MRGDIAIRCAYGAALSIAVTLKNLAGVPINNTGYSSRFIFQRFDDCASYLTVLSLTSGAGQITIGGSNGVFTVTVSGANSTALSAYFGTPTPSRTGRF